MFRRHFPITLLYVFSILVTIGCDTDTTGFKSDSEFVKLQGAGASFPAPLYLKWFKDYNKSHPNIQVDYQSVGSGTGVKSVIDGTVDFGATDAPMSEDEFAKVDRGVQFLPITAGSIVLAFNLEGVDELRLTREGYIGIFLGEITKWNDPKIADSNRGVDLPDSNINVVVRSDSSGTTYVFTKHLSTISPEFAKSPGIEKMPNWAVGTKSKGNEGVTASIKTTPGSIGYVEYAFAKGAKLKMASLENSSGVQVMPSIKSTQAALAAAEVPENLIAWLPDPAGKDSYPIVMYTWLICYKQYSDEKKMNALKEVVKYVITDGQSNSERLGYIPLPASVVEKCMAALDNIKLVKGT